MSKKSAVAESGRVPSARRDLVEIVNVKDKERPLQIFSKASGELIASLKADADVDAFLSLLDEEAFD